MPKWSWIHGLEAKWSTQKAVSLKARIQKLLCKTCMIVLRGDLGRTPMLLAGDISFGVRSGELDFIINFDIKYCMGREAFGADTRLNGLCCR